MKVCFICFDFRKENIRRQPWRYIYELSQGLAQKGVEVVLITDVSETGLKDLKIGIRNVKRFTSRFRVSKELVGAINNEEPDIIITLIGVTSFLKFRGLKKRVNKPIIGVLTSPIYSFGEILKVGIHEFVRHFNYLMIHIVGALIPRFIIRQGAKDYDIIVTLSEDNKKRLEKIGIKTKIVTIKPGIDDHFLEPINEKTVRQIREKLNPENVPLIMYFTSPLTLRGTDTLVKAFGKVRRNIPSKLVFLSRLDHPELIKEEKKLKEIAMKLGIFDSVLSISKMLTPEEVKAYISAADVVVLPFKVVISDVPISILEAMALGKPVISTRVGSIPEILDGKGIIVEPNNPQQLSDALASLLRDPGLRVKLGEEGKKYMERYPRWSEVVDQFFELIKEG